MHRKFIHGGNAENKNVHTPGIWELEIVVRILDTGDLTKIVLQNEGLLLLTLGIGLMPWQKSCSQGKRWRREQAYSSMETNEQSSALLQNRATQAQFVLCLGTYILYSRGRILK